MSDDNEPTPELPPNQPPGLLGEHGLNVMKTDTFEPDGMNAGLIQESTWETRWLTLVILYLVFFPAAYVVLWRSKHHSRRVKITTTLVMTAGLVFVAYLIWR